MSNTWSKLDLPKSIRNTRFGSTGKSVSKTVLFWIRSSQQISSRSVCLEFESDEYLWFDVSSCSFKSYVGSLFSISINSSFSQEKQVTIQSYKKLTLKLSAFKRETSHKLQCMNLCTNLNSINAI